MGKRIRLSSCRETGQIPGKVMAGDAAAVR
jgi:hypothetical protein